MAKKQNYIELYAAYRFCGNGQGIPGLPHEVTGTQAQELGLLDVLEAALKNGNYRIVVKPVAAKSAEEGK